MTAVSVPQHQALVVRYEIFIWTNLFHLSMQGLGLYCPSQPHVHQSEPGRGKIALHLLFGWSLDKDKKSLDQSKQFSWQFGSIQTKAFPNPDQPPLEIFLINQYFCTKNKIIDNEKWKLLETLQYTIKEFNNGNVVCSTMHCPNGSRWGGCEKGCTDFVYSIV